MTDLQSHISIFKGLGFLEHRNTLIRMIWHIATEHGTTKPNLEAYKDGEHITMEDFIKALSSRPTTTNSVEPLKKA